MSDEFKRIQWRDMICGEVSSKVFDCPFCDWHYSPGLMPSAQGEFHEARALQHHIEYRHSWRELIVVGQTLRTRISDLLDERDRHISRILALTANSKKAGG